MSNPWKQAEDRVKDYFRHNSMSHDLFGLVAGDIIGYGAFRVVFDYAPDPDNYVIKFEVGAGSFHNIREWDVWDRVKEADLSRWFAPCYFISPCGTILIQNKAEDVETNVLPKKIPAYFTDVKPDNWGRLPNGDIVCRDYGSNLLLEKGMTKAMRKAFWVRDKATPQKP